MTRWNLSIPDETDRQVRALLGRAGLKESDLSTFVEAAVRGEVLRRTLLEVQARNSDVSPEEALRLANEAVAWARANPA